MGQTNIQGPVAVITGAGSGIGKATAKLFLADGYRVVLCGRRPEPLEAVAAGSESALVLPTDVSDPESVRAMFQAVENQWGRVDVLFNNAGIFGGGSVEELTVKQWSEVIAVNVTGSFLCAAEAVRVMKRQQPGGGRIINNGSVSAYTPRPKSVAYTVSKHAITGLTKSIALDGREHNIACGQIDIGNAATELSQQIASGTLQANGTMLAEPMFDMKHAAEMVLHMARLPLSANVLTATVMASGMPFVGRG